MQCDNIRCNNLIEWMCAFATYVLIVISLINENNTLMVMAGSCALAFALIFDISSAVLLLLGLTVFENAVKIHDIVAWVFIMPVIMAKYFMAHRFVLDIYEKNSIYFSLVLVLVELFTDSISYGIKGRVLTTVVLILFFGMITVIDEEWNLKPQDMVLYLGTAFVLAVIYMLNQYGGLAAFKDSFMNSAYAYRFGHSFGETVGGAMAIPIYALLILSFSIYYFLSEYKVDNKPFNLGIIVIDIFAMVFGALTISRSFFAGLAIIIAFFVMAKTDNRKSRRMKIIVAFVGTIIAIIAFNKCYSLVIRTINNLLSRLGAGGGTGERTDIWASCFAYLVNNPYGVLIGYGSNGYPVIGLKEDALFSAGAHNLYIDVLMSWGLIGWICVAGIAKEMLFKQCALNRASNNVFSMLPLLVLLFFGTTAMRTNSCKTVIYFFCCLHLIQGHHRNLNRGEI